MFVSVLYVVYWRVAAVVAATLVFIVPGGENILTGASSGLGRSMKV